MGGQWRAIPPMGGHLVYLNAERIGPRKFYDRSEVFARHGNLGTRGEYRVELPLRSAERNYVERRSTLPGAFRGATGD